MVDVNHKLGHNSSHNTLVQQLTLNTHFSLCILPSKSENDLEAYLVDNTFYHKDGTLGSCLFVHTHNAYADSDCWSACRIDHTDTYVF
jgi:hypothetical protein